jgi:hypothetical protein
MTRLTHAWRAMEPEQQLATIAALGLFVSMFLPWYSQTNTVVVGNAAKATRTSLSAFEAFSFVEAAVLLVSAGVLAMLFARVEGRDFQLPGGDGTIVMIAGGWTALLVFYRLLDKPGLHGTQRITATVGVQWGIFIALLLALALAYAGWRMRATERPAAPLLRSERPRRRRRHEEAFAPARAPEESEPPGPALGEESTIIGAAPARAGPSAPVPARGRPRYPPAPSDPARGTDSPSARRRGSGAEAEQLSLEDALTEREEPPRSR